MRYLIKELAAMSLEIWDVVLEKEDTARESKDGKVLLKYRGEKPSALASDVTYSHNEILVILQNENWKAQDMLLP